MLKNKKVIIILAVVIVISVALYFYFKKKNNSENTCNEVGIVVKTTETGDKVFLVKCGVASWITNYDKFLALGYTDADIKYITIDEFNKYTIGADI